MQEPLLTIRGLTKSYDDQKMILKDLDIEVYRGEFIVIIGSSGAGKSTFIRCINRLIEPTSGEIIFDGTKVSKLKGKSLRKVRSEMAMIFQDYNLIGPTNVIRNVLHGCLGQISFFTSFFSLYSESNKQEAYDLLKLVGLGDYIYKKARNLSGGQKQRVGICRAMMQKPKLLLADEPIASLDPKSAQTVMDYIQLLSKQRELTCFINLHQVSIAKQYATRIIGLKDGKIVFNDAPEKLTDEIVTFIYESESKYD